MGYDMASLRMMGWVLVAAVVAGVQIVPVFKFVSLESSSQVGVALG